MLTSRPVRSLVVAAGIGVLAGAGPSGLARGQQTAPPEPTFRTDASFVLTDVFVTADGKPVTDLTEADFEVREDGVVQKIRSFEAVRHAMQPVAVASREPTSVSESEAMAADPRRRVFVVFLDTYHVDRADSMVVRQALQTFLKTAFGPDDMIGFMTPHMSGSDVSFSTSTNALLEYLDAKPAWGVGDEMLFTESDPIERELSTCLLGNDAAWGALRSRLREQRSIDALRGLVAYLDGVRETRKAVIAVTCDSAGVQAAYADGQRLFQDLIGEANRASTSFYTMDAKGLRTHGRPGTTIAPAQRRAPDPASAAVEMRNRDRVPYSTPVDSIRTLGEATNSQADGKYRKIKVTVKRPGVRVRAREGYLARRLDERPSPGTSAAPTATTPTPENAQVAAALGRLAPARPGVPLLVAAAAGTVAGSTGRAVRVTAELDSAIAARCRKGRGRSRSRCRSPRVWPVTSRCRCDYPEPAVQVAELALAPLAAGDYVLALSGGPKRLLVPLRIVP